MYINEIIHSVSSVNSLKFIANDKKISSLAIFETYFNIIREMMSLWKTMNDTIVCYQDLFDLFKHCMDIRMLAPSNNSNVNKLEFIVLDCFSCLVLKLTDKEMMNIMEN